jgi:hypothetical protein
MLAFEANIANSCASRIRPASSLGWLYNLTHSIYELPRNDSSPESPGTDYQTAIDQVPLDGETHAEWADNQGRFVGQSQD